jgi:hypothetical protein
VRSREDVVVSVEGKCGLAVDVDWDDGVLLAGIARVEMGTRVLEMDCGVLAGVVVVTVVRTEAIDGALDATTLRAGAMGVFDTGVALDSLMVEGVFLPDEGTFVAVDVLAIEGDLPMVDCALLTVLLAEAVVEAETVLVLASLVPSGVLAGGMAGTVGFFFGTAESGERLGIGGFTDVRATPCVLVLPWLMADTLLLTEPTVEFELTRALVGATSDAATLDTTEGNGGASVTGLAAVDLVLRTEVTD